MKIRFVILFISYSIFSFGLVNAQDVNDNQVNASEEIRVERKDKPMSIQPQTKLSKDNTPQDSTNMESVSITRERSSNPSGGKIEIQKSNNNEETKLKEESLIRERKTNHEGNTSPKIKKSNE